jgi:hypothetical protein
MRCGRCNYTTGDNHQAEDNYCSDTSDNGIMVSADKDAFYAADDDGCIMALVVNVEASADEGEEVNGFVTAQIFMALRKMLKRIQMPCELSTSSSILAGKLIYRE